LIVLSFCLGDSKVALPSEPLAWKFFSSDVYVSVTYEDEVVGFCKPDFAARIVEVLNDDEKLRKALRLACYDLISVAGGNSRQVDELVERYLIKTGQPQSGVAAIATLLHQRQEELDVSDKEFTKFCDSYRLSPAQLQGIYAGEEISQSMLVPLSRILGRSVDDLLQVMEDFPEA
jgi:hypothetical protein